MIEAIWPFAGCEIAPGGNLAACSASPTAFAISDEMGVTMWIANRRDEAMKLEVGGLGTGATAKVLEIDGRTKRTRH